MEVYAGYQENADYNVGRVLDAMEEMGELDDTLVIYIWGDNGASMEGTLTGAFNELTIHNGIVLTEEQQLALIEQYGGLDAWGGPETAPHCSAAGAGPATPRSSGASRSPPTSAGPATRWWSMAAADQGPGRVARAVHPLHRHRADDPRGRRDPGARAVDGIEQKPIEGTSFAYTFGDAGAEERHTQQYFERYGYCGMYKDGWWAGCMLSRIPWDVTPATLSTFAPDVHDPDALQWELYYLPDDFSQARDIAAEHPEKLAELKAAFWEEAERYNVLPLLAGYSVFFGILPPMVGRTKFHYRSDVQNVASGMIPQIYGHSYSISADLVVPDEGVQGVMVAEADHLGGFAFSSTTGCSSTPTRRWASTFTHRRHRSRCPPAR